jgi:hypothetical protein
VRGTRKGGFRRFAVVVAVAAAGVLVVGAHAASAQSIQICKSGTNGMTGRTFNYTVAPLNGTAFGATAIGGRCSGPITYTAVSSTVTVTELQSSPTTDVAKIDVRPSARKQSENLAGRSVTVTAGAASSSETLITFFNEPAGGTDGVIKICKLTQTPAFLGRLFSFSVNGAGAQSTEANDAFADPATWSCRLFGPYQVGSNVTVQEQIPPGVEVQFIDTDPGANLVDFNTDTGTAIVHVTGGTTVVLFDDEPVAPTQTGFIEVCKNPAPFQDPAVTGSWTFTITDAAGNVYIRDVGTGFCSEAIQVAAGVATVQETQRTGFALTGVFTDPAGALLTSNTINGSATVEVPVGATSNDEVQVSFVNEAIRSQLKICKALGAGSSALVGQTFNFTVTNVTDPDNPVPLVGNSSVTAGATTQCVIFGTIPTGTVVTVAEVFGADNPATPLIDESGEFIDQSGPVTTTIGSGINTVTITNTARGVIEVCKDPVAGINTQPTFQFRVDGGALFSVPAGGCSQPRRVAVGNHTVTEVALPNYELTGVTVDPAGRLVGTPDLANRTVTVSVPYGPNGETVVTFTNRIQQGRLKVCKTIPLGSFDSLNGDPFNYNIYIQTGGTHAAPTFNGGGPAGPPIMVTLNASTDRTNLTTCTGFTAFYPILQANGERTIIGVQEQLTGGFVVDSITASPNAGLCVAGPGTPNGNNSPACVPTGIDRTGAFSPGYATIDFFPAGGSLGNAAVTFTNRAT